MSEESEKKFILEELEEVISVRQHLKPEESYVAEMMRGPDVDLYRKLPEEATEVVLACTVGGNLVWELADLWFHSLLVMAKHNVSVSDVTEELSRRRNELRKGKTAEG